MPAKVARSKLLTTSPSPQRSPASARTPSRNVPAPLVLDPLQPVFLPLSVHRNPPPTAMPIFFAALPTAPRHPPPSLLLSSLLPLLAKAAMCLARTAVAAVPPPPVPTLRLCLLCEAEFLRAIRSFAAPKAPADLRLARQVSTPQAARELATCARRVKILSSYAATSFIFLHWVRQLCKP